MATLTIDGFTITGTPEEIAKIINETQPKISGGSTLNPRIEDSVEYGRYPEYNYPSEPSPSGCIIDENGNIKQCYAYVRNIEGSL